MFYPMMTGRFGCFLAVSFAFGIAALFSAFSEMADTKKKKIFHGAVVVCIICVIGFANIGSPTINDDTRLWYEDYTIPYGLTIEDVVSGITVTNNLPDNYIFARDGSYGELMRYTTPYVYWPYHKNEATNNNGFKKETLINFNPYNYKPGTYIMFREILNSAPNRDVYQYGDSELQRYRYYGYLDDMYENVLAQSGVLAYISGNNKMYVI